MTFFVGYITDLVYFQLTILFIYCKLPHWATSGYFLYIWWCNRKFRRTYLTMNILEKEFLEKQMNLKSDFTKDWFRTLIQAKQYVGDVYSISYETALVQIHDNYRKGVGGIPSLSFLIATRIKLYDEEKKVIDKAINYTLEDSSVILLRVMDAAQLPNSDEAERIRVERAQRVSGETDKNWDDKTIMDTQTNYLLSFAGVECRVIGTFFLDDNPNDVSNPLNKRFGSDLSNYYPNQGLKVYKPNDKALKEIVNYQDPDRREHLRSHSRVPIGEVRYASTNRSFQGVSDVEVSISPADLFEQKTALFGMTRTGKSNTTKIIAKAVFDLRFESNEPLRIGQIIFDPNGEYANENVQDSNNHDNPSALKNVWKSKGGEEADVVTYGIRPHINDPNRKLMLLNFYVDGNLQKGKEIINGILPTDSKYCTNFRQIEFETPDPSDRGVTIRYNRRVLAYRSLLAKAGFPLPNNLKPNVKGLFNQNLLERMQNNTSDKATQYSSAAAIFANQNLTWEQLFTAFTSLSNFVKVQDFRDFESWYVHDRPKASGDPWADEDFQKILEMFFQPNGARIIGQARPQHTESTTQDYAVEIYDDLIKGRLVIIDQSSGEAKINKSSAERIMDKIFRENQSKFRESEVPPDILIYIEEAHNLLPSGADLNLEDIWVRTAKEGAKLHLGMVYITQEVSSIQKNILKNTANWFIGHLNNKDEMSELRKFYDFADFEKSILRAQDRGFLRVKTLSNLFVVPVQINKFEI